MATVQTFRNHNLKQLSLAFSKSEGAKKGVNALSRREKRYKMSNENFKHHEDQGEIYGRCTLYIEWCQCDILLCKSTAPLSSKIIFLFEICTKIMHN